MLLFAARVPTLFRQPFCQALLSAHTAFYLSIAEDYVPAEWLQQMLGPVDFQHRLAQVKRHVALQRIHHALSASRSGVEIATWVPAATSATRPMMIPAVNES